MLRETLVWQDGSGGSPTVVAFVTSTALVKNGNGPAGGITIAPAQRSLAGAPPGETEAEADGVAVALGDGVGVAGVTVGVGVGEDAI